MTPRNTIFDEKVHCLDLFLWSGQGFQQFCLQEMQFSSCSLKNSIIKWAGGMNCMPRCTDSSYKHTEKAETWKHGLNIWFLVIGMASLKARQSGPFYSRSMEHQPPAKKHSATTDCLSLPILHKPHSVMSNILFKDNKLPNLFFLSELQRMQTNNTNNNSAGHPSYLSYTIRLWHSPRAPCPLSQLESQATGRRKGEKVTN